MNKRGREPSSKPPYACLTAAPSRADNGAYAVALHMRYYNFVRIHQKLRVSPAMAAGVSNKLWEIGDIARLVETAEGPASRRGPYKGGATPSHRVGLCRVFIQKQDSRDVEIAGEQWLGHGLLFTDWLDLGRRKDRGWRQTRLVELPHCLLVDRATFVKALHHFVDCRHRFTLKAAF